MTKFEEIHPRDVKPGDVLIGEGGSKFKILKVGPGILGREFPYLTVEDESGVTQEHDTGFNTSVKMKREVIEVVEGSTHAQRL